MKKNMLLKTILASALSLALIGVQNPTFAAISGEVSNEADQNSIIADEKPIYKLSKSNNSKMFINLEEKLVQLKDTDSVPVTIVFNRDLSENEYSSIQNIVGGTNFKNKFKVIPAATMDLTKSQIAYLEKLDLVKQVEYDEPVYALNDNAGKWFGTTTARSDFSVDGDRDGNPTSYSKNDVVVAVIDTGIDANHVDLDGGKVIAWKDFVSGKTTPYDDNGHGTHVSATIAGTGEGNSLYKGVAPGAALIGLKVLNSQGSGTMSGVTAAIDWAITNKSTYNIKIISLSLGTPGSSDGTDSTSQAINRAFAAGILPVVAAGNSGPGKLTVGSPGAATNALTVGALADVGEKGFSLAYFSSRGLTADGRIKPDITAPGVNITSAKANSKNQYVSYSGTSMATPFTSGTAALIFDANPDLTPAQVASYITNTAQDWGPTGKDLDYGFGKIDSYAAIKAAGSYTTGTAPTLPTHLYVSNSLAGSSKYDSFTLNVTTTTYPISITLIQPNWSSSLFSQNFNLYLYNPSGTLVASSTGSTRQETIGFTPTVTGNYIIKVLSKTGSGTYFFDVSSSASTIAQTVNQ